MEKPENDKTDGIKLWIDFDGAAESEPLRHANQMTLQFHEDEVFLSFFQLSPPILMGDSEEQRTQLKNRESILPECVARLNMTPRFLKKVLEVIQENVEKYEAVEDIEDKATD